MTAADSKGLSDAISDDPMDSFLWRVRADQFDENGEGSAERCRYIADVIDGVIKVKFNKKLLALCKAQARYTGRKVKVTVATSVTCWDVNPSGGTRNRYHGLYLGTDHVFESLNLTEGRVLPIVPGVVRVVHSMFQGHDCGIEVFVHPFDITTHTELVE